MILHLVLDDTGKVTESTVVESGGPQFDEEARHAAEKLTFRPATKGGKPVSSKIAYRFDFVDPDLHVVDTAGKYSCLFS